MNVNDERGLPFAGVNCRHEDDECKLWWAATIGNKTTTLEARIPKEMKDAKTERQFEIMLEGIFKASTVALGTIIGRP